MKSYCRFRPAVAFLSVLSLTVMIALFSQSAPLGAAPEDGDGPAGGAYLATVDLAVLFALHPQMQYYDQKAGLFIKPPKLASNYQEFLNVIKNRSKDFARDSEANAPEIKRLKFEIETLKAEIEKLETLKAGETAAITQKYDAMSEDEKNKNASARAEELNAVEKKFKADLDAKKQKHSDLLDAFEKIQRSLLKVYYLSPEETAKKFDEINGEIRRAVLKEAKKNGARSIINLNLMAPRPEKASAPAARTSDEKAAFGSMLESLAASGPDYTKILGALKTFEGGVTKDLVSTRNPEFSETEYVSMLKKMQRDQEMEMASSSFFTKDYIMRLAPVKKIASSPIIYGGTDLTRGAAIEILTANGVSKEKAAALCDAVLNN